MTDEGEGDGKFRFAVLKDLRSQFDSLPPCVRATTLSLTRHAMTDPEKVAQLAEGQQLISGLSHDRESNKWYFVRFRFTFDAKNATAVIVWIAPPVVTHPFN
jgi:hypothetical protein